MEYEWNHRIHPVRDGVCRTSCAVTALIFSSYGLPQPRLQISSDDKDSRKQYYDAFDEAEAASRQALRDGSSPDEARWIGIRHFAEWYLSKLIV
jgi:Fic family protein